MSGSDLIARIKVEAASWRRDDCMVGRDPDSQAEFMDEIASRIASLETALKERTAELKIATGALQADGRFAETVKVLTDVLDEYDSEEG